ncbi:KH domain-containing RNA-binding protein QKI isoform X3 [Ascaphus truei]|uniref:KH domain-containing RNA-binding protein QKI isoform X3 n=1 Tax=Ascaphus truei TaxID=8439 RepID=UPI003F59F178
MVGELETREKPKPTPDYLMQLMNDKKLMSSLPNFCGIFNHLERLLDDEISRVRKDMYNDTLNGSTERRCAELPDGIGPIVQLQEKLYVPVKEYPDFNFVGRILGPRGLTAKQLEAETGCKIMVRGKGSMRDKKKHVTHMCGSMKNTTFGELQLQAVTNILECSMLALNKEEQNRGKPNWEHLNEDLHVLITVEDAQNRAEVKLKRAVEEVKKLLVPAAEGEDSLKKMQLMELAILNGTYRDANIKSPLAFSLAATAQAPRILTGPAPVMPQAALRTPTPAGPTLMPLIRQIQTAVMPNGTHHQTLLSQGPEGGLIYTPYDYPYALAPGTSILEYPIDASGVLGWPFQMPPQAGHPWARRCLPEPEGAVATKVRRHDMRVHPYQRIVTADRDEQLPYIPFNFFTPGELQKVPSEVDNTCPVQMEIRHRQLTYDLLTSELFTQ